MESAEKCKAIYHGKANLLKELVALDMHRENLRVNEKV